MSHIYINTETYGGSIDLRPLKELMADPERRNNVDLGGIDPEAVLAMDENRDGFLSFSEYMTSSRLVLETAIEEYSTGRLSPDYHNFLRLVASLNHISRDMHARQLFPETVGMTSREACGYFRGLVDGPPTSLDASGLFFCRGDDLVDATGAILASDHDVMNPIDEDDMRDHLSRTTPLDHVLRKIPEGRRTDVIQEGLSNGENDEMREYSAGAIRYAPLGYRYHLYRTALMDPFATPQLRRTVIEDSSFFLFDQNQVNELIWLGLRDPEPEVRRVSVIRLDRQPAELASGSILYVLSTDEDAEVRREAAAAIRWAHPATQQFLVDLALDDRNIHVNRAALDLMIEMISSLWRRDRYDWHGLEPEWVLDAFAKALRNRYPVVFEPAVRALLLVPPRYHAPLVRMAVDNPSFEAFVRGERGRLATLEADRVSGRRRSVELVEEEIRSGRLLEVLKGEREEDSR